MATNNNVLESVVKYCNSRTNTLYLDSFFVPKVCFGINLKIKGSKNDDNFKNDIIGVVRIKHQIAFVKMAKLLNSSYIYIYDDLCLIQQALIDAGLKLDKPLILDIA